MYMSHTIFDICILYIHILLKTRSFIINIVLLLLWVFYFSICFFVFLYYSKSTSSALLHLSSWTLSLMLSNKKEFYASKQICCCCRFCCLFFLFAALFIYRLLIVWYINFIIHIIFVCLLSVLHNISATFCIPQVWKRLQKLLQNIFRNLYIQQNNNNIQCVDKFLIA